jgi:hypothetical protein
MSTIENTNGGGTDNVSPSASPTSALPSNVGSVGELLSPVESPIERPANRREVIPTSDSEEEELILIDSDLSEIGRCFCIHFFHDTDCCNIDTSAAAPASAPSPFAAVSSAEVAHAMGPWMTHMPTHPDSLGGLAVVSRAPWLPDVKYDAVPNGLIDGHGFFQGPRKWFVVTKGLFIGIFSIEYVNLHS